MGCFAQQSADHWTSNFYIMSFELCDPKINWTNQCGLSNFQISVMLEERL